MIEKAGGRKFLFQVLLVVLVSIGFFLGKIDAQLYLTAILGIGGSYIAGNVAAKFAPVQ